MIGEELIRLLKRPERLMGERAAVGTGTESLEEKRSAVVDLLGGLDFLGLLLVHIDY